MTSSDRKRRLTQERKILRSESRWLQKALFALQKAEQEHAKLRALRDAEERTFAVTVDGDTHAIDQITSALKDTVNARLEQQRIALRDNRAVAGGA